MANSNVSEEAKEHSRQVLEETEGPGKLPGQQSVDEGKNVGNVIDGHKVRIRCKNLARVFVDVHPGRIEEPNISQEAKENFRQVLDEMDT